MRSGQLTNLRTDAVESHFSSNTTNLPSKLLRNSSSTQSFTVARASGIFKMEHQYRKPQQHSEIYVDNDCI